MIRWLLNRRDRQLLKMLDEDCYVVAIKSDDGSTLTEVSFRGNYRVPKGYRKREIARHTYHREASS